MQHRLKTDPKVFDEVAAGLKTFEIRYDDRGYQVGDILELAKTRYTSEEMRNGKPLEYTGQIVTVGVSHIMRGPIYGFKERWVIMSIKMS